MQLLPDTRAGWLWALVRVSGAVLCFLLLIVGAGLWLRWAPGSSFKGPLPAATQAQEAIATRLRADVTMLATTIGVRQVLRRPKALQAAADHIVAELDKAGYTARKLPFNVRKKVVNNLEVTIPGTTRKDEIVVLGAHYDSVATTPGADDNASGVAVLLELARQLQGHKPKRTLRLVFFVNEEPPFFKHEWMGSLVYAKAAKAAGEHIVAMASLEMLGYYDATPGSQHYPFGLGMVYPDTADFVTFVGTIAARPVVHAAIASFREAVQFPSEAITAPDSVQGIDYSDHWSFMQTGVPSIMVTDTSFYRTAHYHELTDTADTLDYGRMARVTEGLIVVARSLGGDVDLGN